MFNRNGPRDRDDARRTRPKPRRGRPWLALLAALVAVSVWAIPALGTPTKDVTVDPNASAGAPGFTDLDTLTYAQAKTRLDQLSEITLPAAVSGLELIDVSNVRLDSNDAGHSLSLSGSANLPALHGGNQSVDLLVTAVWPDDTSTEPKLAIAAKTDDLALSEVNPLWDDTYGDVRFATARLAVSSADQQIDPATLPAAAREFYAEPVELTGGVSFAGRLQLDGRLADAFGYAGYAGEVDLEGSLAASPAALFGHASDTQLGALRLKATLGKSPTAPAWIADRTSTYEFTIANRRPGLSIDEALTVALDGTTNHFRGHVPIAPTGAIEGEVGIDGALDAPFGLPANLSDLKLRLSRDQGTIKGALSFGIDVDGSPVHVTAGLVTGGGTTRADFSVDGSLTVPRLTALGGALLGTPVADVPGADDVSLDRVSFSFSRGLFSIGAKATIRQLQADAVLTLRSTPGTPAKPLLAMRLRDARMSELSTDAGELGDVQLPALSLTATTLTELAAEDLTPQEQEFFGDEAIGFSPGLSVDARLPLDALGVREALGFPAGSEVKLRGTLGAVTLSDLRGSRVSLHNLNLQATLPAATDSTLLPTWVRPSGPTTLRFRYENGAVAASFATSAHVLLGSARLATTIEGRLAHNGARTSIGFTGTLANWRQPYGVSWIPTLDQARFRLDTTFGGAQPPVVRGSVAASAVLRGKPFALEFGLSSASATTANLTARFEGRASLGEIVRAFPNLGGATADIAANPDLNALEIGPVRASVIVGQSSAFELTASTRYRNLESDLLVAVRTDGRFTVGIKPRGSVDLDQLAADAPAINVALPKAAIVLGSEEGRQPVNRLTDGEYDFYKTLYGCADDAARGTCAGFTSVELVRGLKLIAAFDLGDDIERMAGEIGIQTGGHALVEGKIPVFGGSEFSLRASLGDFRFAKQPDWFHHGNVSLEIGTGGLKFVGSLGVKIERQGWTKPCDALPYEQKCYDLLNFRITAGVELQPTPSFTLTGALETEQPWKNAFGQSWLEIRRVALQLGVTLGAGPEVTMGFQGDIKIGSKDVAAALKVGLAPMVPPPFVRVNLIGFSAASRAGIALSDLMWLNQQITGTQMQLDSAATPDISLRNLFLQYSQQTDRDLCLTRGIRFNADLYVGSNLPPVESGAYDVSGCRTLEVDPNNGPSCIANQANGCLARVFGRIDSSGLLAGGELSGFTLGPITLQDSSLDLALTPTDQHLRMKGGAQIGSFARGQAELAISRSGFAFTGDAELFGQNAVHGYLEANAAFDLRNPSFNVQAWLHADARSAITNAVGPRAERLRVPIAAFGELLRVIQGSGSVADVARLRQLLESSGATVPSEVRTMLDVLSNAQKQINDYGRPALTLQPLLRGFSFGVGGTPGWRDPATCPVFEVDGGCWITPPIGLIPGLPAPWEPGRCHNTVVNGVCYFTPPFTVTVGGICSELNIRSQDCSWATLMQRFVLQPLLDAAERTTGVRLNATTLADLVSRFATGAGSIITVDCAYFSADATRLTQGNVSVDLAARLRLFGREVKLGAGWNFRATGQTADGVVSSIIQSLFSTSRPECPNPPAGHDQPRPDTGVRSQTLTAALMQPTVDEGGVATVSATFDTNALRYPAVTVRWGDGATSTIPAGESQTVTASHSYANEANPTIAVTVQDAGAHTRQLVARVLNVKPATTALGATPSAPNERDVVTLRGVFTDPGERDRHTVRIDWGDGAPLQVLSLAAGARTYAVPHRYEDDGSYRVTVDLLDDTGAIESRRTAVGVSNVAPSAITMHPRVPATEGATVAYAIEFADPGERDAHTVTVDWGDGSSQTVPVGERKRYVEVPHRYADDGSYDVRLTVDDGDRGLGRATASMRVRNVAPTVAAKLETNAIAAGTRARLFGTIDDPGVDDAHTVTIDWGTGYEKIDLARGQRTFEAEKPYDTAGQFTITADVSDEDDAHGQASLPLTVG